MKKYLLFFVCTGIASTYILNVKAQVKRPPIAEIKGNPQLKAVAPDQQVSAKGTSLLGTELISLSANSSKEKNSAKAKPSFPTAFLKNHERFMQFSGDDVIVDITVKGDDNKQAKADLEKMGAKIINSYGRVISAKVPVKELAKLEGIASLKFVRPALKPMRQGLSFENKLQKRLFTVPPPITPVISQGDTAQASYLARKKYKVNGAGVKVGILSDSYDNLGTADVGVHGGELPGPGNPFGFTEPVEVLSELDGGGTDEGRAMAEIVHDVAPGSPLAFHTAFNGEADFAQGIIDLAHIGCKVITDDVFYFDEPFYQDGIVAQAVDEVKQKGVTYFSAAGNNSDISYESKYRPSNFYPLGVENGSAHNFAAKGQPPIYFQPVYIPPGGDFTASFQWDQPFYSAGGLGAETDMDIYLLDEDGNIVDLSYNDNIASGDPFELLSYYNSTDSHKFYVLILKYDGPNPNLLKYIDFGYSTLYSNAAIPGLFGPTLYGHRKADGSAAVAAARFYQTPAYGVKPPLVEYFSSLGGIPNYFNLEGKRIKPVLRYKPEFTAPDGANTSFFDPLDEGSLFDNDSFPNFFGTSAAAPHAAGAAALMIEARKGKAYTPEQIRFFLASTAIDMDSIYTPGFDKGYDYNTGFGLINAEAAVGQIVKYASQRPAIVTAEVLNNLDAAVVYPNPSASNFRLYLQMSDAKQVDYELFGIDGKVIAKKSVVTNSVIDIDASKYKAGMYVLKVKQGDQNKTFKLIKQ